MTQALHSRGLPASRITISSSTPSTIYQYRTVEGSKVTKRRYSFAKDGERKKSFVWFDKHAHEGLKGETALLYRHDVIELAVQAGKVIDLPEGEEKVHTFESFGRIAVCAPNGSGSRWTPELVEPLRGAHVILWPDNDDPGKQHMEKAEKALQGVAASVCWGQLPNLPHKGDVVDWKNAGGTRDQLEEIGLRAIEPDKSASAGQRPRFLSLRELYAQPDEATEWLVADRLPRAGTSFFVAKPKVGKSVTVQNLAVSVAQGFPFLGCAVQQGPVLYCALEEKAQEIKQHFRAIGGRSEDPLHVYVSAAPEDAMDWLRQAGAEYKPVLIIVDPWHRLTRVRDINDYAAVSLAMEPLMSLARESGAHLAFTHHGRKGGSNDGDDVLGSTALFGGVDTLMEMRRSETHRTIWSIQRYGSDMPKSVIEMDQTTFRVSLAGTQQEADARVIGEEILGWLAGRDPVDEPTIHDNVEGRTGLIRETLRALCKDGRVARTGEGKKGSPYMYSRFLVPTIYTERENENVDSPTLPLDTGINTRSRSLSCPECGRSNAGCHYDPDLDEWVCSQWFDGQTFA